MFIHLHDETFMVCCLKLNLFRCRINSLGGSTLRSYTGILIYNLVYRLSHQYQLIPREYIVLLTDLAKYSSVSGYLQPTGPEALEVLRVKINHINHT